MRVNDTAPWHKESYDRFLHERLPKLLAERLPLAGYSVDPGEERTYQAKGARTTQPREMTGVYTCDLRVTLMTRTGSAEVLYAELPYPDDAGLFLVDGIVRVVVPIATSEDLDTADILCVGEQLYQHIEQSVGMAPESLPWDEPLLRSWLPLDVWIKESLEVGTIWRQETPWFVQSTSHWLDCQNWLAEKTHLRRLVVPDRGKAYHPSEWGRACPFETPEGPNIGHMFTVANGTTIRDGKLVVEAHSPEDILGLSALMVPFIEHNDANRQLMGVNMVRQWCVPPDPEPAVVQSGNEPDAPGFWCGRNLLTAFVSWGADTFDDALVISESCAQRLDFPHPAEPGDKLSNRHGSKGTVSRILPDDEMPHLPDGTPVELVFSFTGCHTRMNFGQIREAVMSRIARAEGAGAIVPPFGAPTGEELRERLRNAGLPESGMETLTLGRHGKKLERPSTVGWVYWGKTHHLAKTKLWTAVRRCQRGQRQSEFEYYALRDVGALENLLEHYNTCSAWRADADTLADRVASGPIDQAGPPTPMFADLVDRLRVAGIDARLEEDGLHFTFTKSMDNAIELAQPIPHPWLPERELREIGACEALMAYDAIAEANAELEHLLSADAKQPRVSEAVAELETHVMNYFHTILPPEELHGGPVLRLAQPVDNPWNPGHPLTEIREFQLAGKYAAVRTANDKLARMLDSAAPTQLVEQARDEFQERVQALFDMLLPPPRHRIGANVLFSGRSVMSPGADLRFDQVGIPDEMAWTLFGPLVVRELGDAEEVDQRTSAAARVLDEVMARSWVMLQRAPVVMPTAILAFRPIRHSDRAVHVPTLACGLMNADFDGDQVAVFLPLTEAAQQEAGERLSIAGHLRRDPEVLRTLIPGNAPLWGLAALSLVPEGQRIIDELAGVEVPTPEGYVTYASLSAAMRTTAEHEGVEPMLEALERLLRRGFKVAKASGASMSPFFGESAEMPLEPATDDVEAWEAHADAIREHLASRTDFDSNDLGPQLLAARSCARGTFTQIATVSATRGAVTFGRERPGAVRHGYVEGLTPEEVAVCVESARAGLAETLDRTARAGFCVRDASRPRTFNVLARAMRAERPGIVFARAAIIGEVDPLADIDSRLFVGLPVPAPANRERTRWSADPWDLAKHILAGVDTSKPSEPGR